MNRTYRRKQLTGAREDHVVYSEARIRQYERSLELTECDFPKGAREEVRLFAIQDVGVVLGDLCYNAVRRWIKLGCLPPPVVQFVGSNVGQCGYTLKEVLALSDPIREHRKEKHYLQVRDVATVRAIYTRISAVRQLHGKYGTDAFPKLPKFKDDE